MSKTPASARVESRPRVWVLHRDRSRVRAVHDVGKESLRSLYRERGVRPSVQRYWLQDRPGESSITLSELLTAIEEKRCDVIVLEDTTRLSREPSEVLCVMNAAKRHGVRVLFELDRIDTARDGGESVAGAMLCAFRLEESRIRSARARRSRSSGRTV